MGVSILSPGRRRRRRRETGIFILHYTQSSTASLAVIVFISSLESPLPKIPLVAREEYKAAVAIFLYLFTKRKKKCDRDFFIFESNQGEEGFSLGRAIYDSISFDTVRMIYLSTSIPLPNTEKEAKACVIFSPPHFFFFLIFLSVRNRVRRVYKRGPSIYSCLRYIYIIFFLLLSKRIFKWGGGE